MRLVPRPRFRITTKDTFNTLSTIPCLYYFIFGTKSNYKTA